MKSSSLWGKEMCESCLCSDLVILRNEIVRHCPNRRKEEDNCQIATLAKCWEKREQADHDEWTLGGKGYSVNL